MSYLAYIAQRGFPLTQTFTKAFACRLKWERWLLWEGRSEWTLVGWVQQQHPELTLHKPDKLERSRTESLNPEVVKQYFELLNEVMEKNSWKLPPGKSTTVMKRLCRSIILKKKQLHLRRAKTRTCKQRYIRAHHYALCCVCSWPTSSPHDYLLQVISRRAVSFRRAWWCPLREEWLRLDRFEILFEMDARFQESDTESDDGVLCTICSQKEPPGFQDHVLDWLWQVWCLGASLLCFW